ncbi:MAG: glycosyltransferase [Phascolarctobacterium sp.]|nr:MAG: glycosyltransferase [Phascolarctobacterium sp.]
MKKKELLRYLYYTYRIYGFKYLLNRILVHLHIKTDRPELYMWYKNLPSEKYPEKLKLWYYFRTGRVLDLENPKTLNEKIQWLKLYDSTPLKTKLADKYLVREYIKEKIGEEYLVPLLGIWNSFDEIDFSKLPEQFVLKANHGSGWNIIVKNKKYFNKSEAKKKFDLWLHINYAFISGFELHYKDIIPKIVAEKYIEEINQVYDYKFMCFNGKVAFIWVDSDRFTDHKRTLFNMKWEKLNIKLKYPVAKYDIPKPYNFRKMLEFAEILSKDFAHARIDFYEIKHKLYFGEITFTTGSGTEEPEPYRYAYKWGRLLRLPN